MSDQEQINFARIEKAIRYIHDNFQNQPTLDEVAAAVNLSAFHFQRLFSQWAGVSPKTLMQYLSIEHPKTLLKDKQATLADTVYETGFRVRSVSMTCLLRSTGKRRNKTHN